MFYDLIIHILFQDKHIIWKIIVLVQSPSGENSYLYSWLTLPISPSDFVLVCMIQIIIYTEEDQV